MNSWRNLKLAECLEKSPRAAKIPRKKFKGSGRFPIVSQEKGLVNGYWDDENDALAVDRPIIIYGDHTQVIKLVDFDFVVGADGVRLLKPKSFLNPEYLYYFLLGNPVKPLGYARHFRLLKDIDVTIPPLPEQKRIVAILDEAFAGIATAIANTEKNLANARELFESYLSAVFSQRGVGWADYRLGDIVTRLTNGYVGPTRGIYQTTGVPYLLARHVKNNRLNFDGKTFITREFNAKNKKSILKYEDVLLVQSGHIGHSAVVTQEHEGHNCHAMIVLTPLNDIVTGPYLSLFFNSPLMQEEFQRIRSGSTVPHLTCREVKELVVTAPKVAEQRSIVERSQEIESRVLELVSIGQQKLNALTELKQCLLQKAFCGELTATPRKEIETALA